MHNRHHYRPPPATLGNGRYVLGESLGAGGMASVYRVHDEHDRCDRAVKILNEAASKRSKTRSRFLQEAHTMARLDHPNIIRISDVGEEDGFYYFVMELAEGGALSSLMRRLGVLDARTALRYAFEALAGLEHAHRAGVVHRDIKPHNLLLSADDHVKLTDFGIARLLSDADAMRITGTGDMLGTLAYMAPEQRLDPRSVAPTADLFSVGAMLYLMLTGRRPLELTMGPADPEAVERIPAPARALVLKATSTDPAARYANARQMAEAVARLRASVDPALDVAVQMDVFYADDDTVLAVRSDEG